MFILIILLITSILKIIKMNETLIKKLINFFYLTYKYKNYITIFQVKNDKMWYFYKRKN